MNYPRFECLKRISPRLTDVGSNIENMFYMGELAQG